MSADSASGATSRSPNYSRTAQYLHWAVAAMIVLQFVLIEFAEATDSRIAKLGLIANHKSVGMTILMLAVLRLAWRLMVKPPQLPRHMPNWQVRVSALTHWALYFFLFALPLTGWLMSSAASYSVSWFSLFTWPDLIGADAGLKDTLKTVHELLAKALFLIALVHVLAACKHHFIDKDDVLKRISAVIPLALFGVIVAGGTWALTNTGSRSGNAERADQTTGDTVAEATGDDTAATDLPTWDIDYDTSFIEFTAEQAGAPFTGKWTQWQASIQFSDDALATSVMDVTITVAGVSTNDQDRDDTLLDTEFFDAENHPAVRFKTDAIRRADDGYVADATLTIKGKGHPIEFRFDIDADGASRQLTGEARLDRLALGVGVGEWEDTEWVGQYVDVKVGVNAVLPQE